MKERIKDKRSLHTADAIVNINARILLQLVHFSRSRFVILDIMAWIKFKIERSDVIEQARLK